MFLAICYWQLAISGAPVALSAHLYRLALGLGQCGGLGLSDRRQSMFSAIGYWRLAISGWAVALSAHFQGPS
ncbi:MAG TPA: hypothetical protein VMU04_22770, partial [Candidatus Acidoferrum sp.]|nr:hypothetical protein [Candidatus Acidoferrum sp.]